MLAAQYIMSRDGGSGMNESFCKLAKMQEHRFEISLFSIPRVG